MEFGSAVADLTPVHCMMSCAGPAINIIMLLIYLGYLLKLKELYLGYFVVGFGRCLAEGGN